MRLQINQGELAEKIEVSTRTVASWETGQTMPPADALSQCNDLGMDVFYIVAGKRGAKLSDDESKLVQAIKYLSPKAKFALEATIAAFELGDPPTKSQPSEPKVSQTFHGPVGQINGENSPVHMNVKMVRKKT